jgi:hypothetical protein
VPLSLLVVAGAWIYSQIDPQSLGVCHEIALYFGKHPTARDCGPYSAPDLVIAVGAIMAFWVLVTGGEVPFTIPGLPPLVVARRAKETANELRGEADALEQRLEDYVRFRDSVAPGARGSDAL